MAKRLLRCIDGHVFDASISTRCPICGLDAVPGAVSPETVQALGDSPTAMNNPAQTTPPTAKILRVPLLAGAIIAGVAAAIIALWLANTSHQTTSMVPSANATGGAHTHANVIAISPTTAPITATNKLVGHSTGTRPTVPAANITPVTPAAVKTTKPVKLAAPRPSVSQAQLAAMVNKGVAFATGHGEMPNEETALYWFHKAAKLGSARAMNILGWVYTQGMGVQPSGDTAKTWFDRSIRAGDATANYGLGMVYDNGLATGIAHPNRAIMLYRKAAQAGSANAMYAIGNHYLNGFGVGKNYAKALQWFLRGAKAGSAQAMRGLGHMYMHGLGTPVDVDAGIRWNTAAIKAGITSGMPEIPSH